MKGFSGMYMFCSAFQLSSLYLTGCHLFTMEHSDLQILIFKFSLCRFVGVFSDLVIFVTRMVQSVWQVL